MQVGYFKQKKILRKMCMGGMVSRGLKLNQVPTKLQMKFHKHQF